ncbi:unnamed protein product [Closterium sp. NIES-65]|nr:unnamed protein product [Closterium sp. NIES-65]
MGCWRGGNKSCKMEGSSCRIVAGKCSYRATAASVGAISGERAAVVAAPYGVAAEVRDRALARPAGAVEATAGAEESAARAAETADGVARAAGEAGNDGDAAAPPQAHNEVLPALPKPTPMQAGALIEGQEETARTGNPESASIHTPHLLTHSPSGAPTLCPHPHRHSIVTTALPQPIDPCLLPRRPTHHPTTSNPKLPKPTQVDDGGEEPEAGRA